MNIKLTLAFDGTNYHGWQAQKDPSLPTIQSTLLTAITQIMPTETLQGCSRTDAGVHAHEFLANFHTARPIPIANIPRALNSLLPTDIRITHAESVPDEFNSRFDVRSKTYTYTIDNNPIASPFSRHFAWHFPHHLNIPEMEKAAQLMVGTHDFSCFSASGDQRENRIRTINSLAISSKQNTITIEINADAYLYNMVRIITGTLVEIGNGKLPADSIPQIIASKNRHLAGTTAPPHGLALHKVHTK